MAITTLLRITSAEKGSAKTNSRIIGGSRKFGENVTFVEFIIQQTVQVKCKNSPITVMLFYVTQTKWKHQRRNGCVEKALTFY